MEINDEENDFFSSFMKSAQINESQLWISGDKTNEEKLENIKLNIKKNIDSYWNFVQDLNIQRTIQEHPTSFYTKEIESGKLNLSKVKQTKNPIYSTTLFDSIHWWKTDGFSNWKELGGIALVVLAKPHHNGYQERVFSHGTFTDDVLRKRMKEQTFEMNVLQLLKFENY
jgi:hypothetical protein